MDGEVGTNALHPSLTGACEEEEEESRPLASEQRVLAEGGVEIVVDALAADVACYSDGITNTQSSLKRRRFAEDSAAAAEFQRCGGCTDQPAKYTCPRCNFRSCSLSCCKRHKVDLDCSGQRNPVAFTPLQNMDDQTLSSDLHFLEGGMRTVDVAKRLRPASNRFNAPKKISILEEHCGKRNIRLHVLSRGMSRRTANTSYYSLETDEIQWKIEWQFPASNATHFDSRISEKEPLLQALKRHLQECADLSLYKAHSPEDLSIVMRKERVPANKVSYFEMSSSKTLKELLHDKDIIEFPTLLVLLPEERSKYPVVYVGEQGEESVDLFNLSAP
eukprot:TRINITY_DN4528_c0_g1_i2.p1 TRINITY_DN4528_c0_g1~~TRINITY_DN4528_c0_g1_i2.p1  ORF type:complete len:332 (-),score=44.60 TRINITY_DN4528_c0_g1_i2:183-1178(-)